VGIAVGRRVGWVYSVVDEAQMA